MELVLQELQSLIPTHVPLHRKQLLELSAQHERELAAQLAQSRAELAEREERARRQAQDYEDRSGLEGDVVQQVVASLGGARMGKSLLVPGPVLICPVPHVSSQAGTTGGADTGVAGWALAAGSPAG